MERLGLSGPSFGGELVDLPIGGVRQLGEDVEQVSEGIKPAPTVAFDDGVENGATLAGAGLADEQPVLFSESCGADGIFHQVLVDLDAAIAEVDAELRPKVERVIDSQAHGATRQVTTLHLEAREDTMQPSVNGFGLMSAGRGTKLWPTLGAAQFSFETVEMTSLAKQPRCHQRVLFARLVELAANVRPARGRLPILFLAGKAGVGRVAVALYRAAKIHRQHAILARCAPTGLPLVNDITAGARSRPK